MTLSIVIAGRPNVGKSTLFNRLAGKRLALVDDMPGLTRDRKEAEAVIGKRVLRLTDTAGLEEAEEGSIAARMSQQSQGAIHSADLILFMIDVRTGITPADEQFALDVRATGKPVILVANKCEGRTTQAGFYEAFKLGLGEPVGISAEHGTGIGELYERVGEVLDGLGDEGQNAGLEADIPSRERALKLAIVGRPNAGKSTLVNTLLGEERMITGPEPGLTRDSVSTDFTWQGREIKLFDTAGLRRKSRISEKAEKLAVGDALNAIRFAEVIVLLIDVEQALDKQDLQLASLSEREGRALVIGINKWDLVADRDKLLRELRLQVTEQLPQVKGVPVVPVSALSGRGADKLMKAVFEVYEAWNKRVSTAGLNRWFGDAIDNHPPPAVSGKRLKLRYITQSNARPPTFIMFCSRPESLPESYKRYLVNGLRDAFGLHSVPIRLHLRKPKNPYADDKS
ncbi:MULTISPECIES: ribosome biogenesis GTPase Der [Rhodomicrobium]|uniref:ribosome biogenesis GTPase Der n=1 Tax=Rhodomicrobium TaxID=1068 RepID=UPI000B4A97A0|nr:MULTISPECIES: ribosome biogenesis GTPase Der [Rhodomicrobium]